jgi:uncharacterized protein YoxC
MPIIVQVAILIVAIALAVLIILAIPILLDLNRILKKWKKVTAIIELGITPLTMGISLLVKSLEKLVEVGRKNIKEEEKR